MHSLVSLRARRPLARASLLLASLALVPAAPIAAQDMMMSGPLGITTDRQSSGTSWQPEALPMPYRQFLAGRWDVMAHWNVFAQYDEQFGPRGRAQFGSVNWSMVMASRPLLGGRLQLRSMNSLEPLTIGRCGYPYLLQSGETCHGAPNADRQHPHDFFMEAAALYERALSSTLAWSVYVAPSGEPAAGPAAFMHRPSAVNDPMSNVTHHWQDATHITFGVVTGALYTSRWKLEGSVFNAREPDEHRWNFDLGNARLSSFAGRVSFNPSTSWSTSGSFAWLKGAEPGDPEQGTHRATASVAFGKPFGEDRSVAAAVVWGANRRDGQTEHSVLAEANVDVDRRNAVFFRAEHVAKTDEDLGLGATGEYFPVASIGLGYVRELGAVGVFSNGIGVRGAVNLIPSALESTYGSRTPKGLVVFLRVRPKRMTSEEIARMHERMKHAGMKM